MPVVPDEPQPGRVHSMHQKQHWRMAEHDGRFNWVGMVKC